MGDNQFLPGYCLLMAYPQADQLIELPEKQRHVFLEDMSLLGEASTSVSSDGTSMPSEAYAKVAHMTCFASVSASASRFMPPQ
jgi:diadenosine tetraphosphate (Ap4A) HIT family hydrolase